MYVHSQTTETNAEQTRELCWPIPLDIKQTNKYPRGGLYGTHLHTIVQMSNDTRSDDVSALHKSLLFSGASLWWLRPSIHRSAGSAGLTELWRSGNCCTLEQQICPSMGLKCYQLTLLSVHKTLIEGYFSGLDFLTLVQMRSHYKFNESKCTISVDKELLLGIGQEF